MIDTAKPVLLCPHDLAAIVGKLLAIADEDAYHQPKIWRKVQECLRMLEHAQTPDYSAGREDPRD